MILYRVFPYHSSAAPTEPGGALFVPRGGDGRFDNPSLYRSFYTSLEPECAIAEHLGDYDVWRDVHLLQKINLYDNPLSLAIATYNIAANLVDLISVNKLQQQGVLRITEIATRHRKNTQALAGRLFNASKAAHAGLQWWSFHLPEWTNVMLWDADNLTLAGAPEVLTLRHPWLVDAARTIHRTIAAATLTGPTP